MIKNNYPIFIVIDTTVHCKKFVCRKTRLTQHDIRMNKQCNPKIKMTNSQREQEIKINCMQATTNYFVALSVYTVQAVSVL